MDGSKNHRPPKRRATIATMEAPQLFAGASQRYSMRLHATSWDSVRPDASRRPKDVRVQRTRDPRETIERSCVKLQRTIKDKHLGPDTFNRSSYFNLDREHSCVNPEQAREQKKTSSCDKLAQRGTGMLSGSVEIEADFFRRLESRATSSKAARARRAGRLIILWTPRGDPIYGTAIADEARQKGCNRVATRRLARIPSNPLASSRSPPVSSPSLDQTDRVYSFSITNRANKLCRPVYLGAPATRNDGSSAGPRIAQPIAPEHVGRKTPGAEVFAFHARFR